MSHPVRVKTATGWQDLALVGPPGPPGPAGPVGAGSGDVNGPASAVADRIAVYNSTTGKLIKDGGKTLADLTTDFVNASGDTMSGTLTIANGTAAAPSLNFAAGAAYGLYWFGSAIGFTAGGAVRLSIGSTATSTVLWKQPDGSAAAPSYSFTNSTNAGLYRTATAISMATGGVESMRWTAADNSTLALGKLVTAASATAASGFNLPHGTAPTTPTNGDIWTTTTSAYARINGTTVDLAVPSGGGGGGTAATTTFTPAGNVAATDVQAAIVELDTEKQPLDATLTSFAGIDAAAGLIELVSADLFTKRSIGVSLTTSIPTRADADARFAAIGHVGTGGTAHANAIAAGAAGFMTGADKTKLDGVATGATANSADATLLARANHTGTQSADTLTDGTTNKAFLATERTKLTGIATGATANSADATLLARANHTGTQLASTISDFNTAADARVALKITSKITVASTAPGSPTTNDVWIDTT